MLAQPPTTFSNTSYTGLRIKGLYDGAQFTRSIQHLAVGQKAASRNDRLSPHILLDIQSIGAVMLILAAKRSAEVLMKLETFMYLLAVWVLVHVLLAQRNLNPTLRSVLKVVENEDLTKLVSALLPA